MPRTPISQQQAEAQGFDMVLVESTARNAEIALKGLCAKYPAAHFCIVKMPPSDNRLNMYRNFAVFGDIVYQAYRTRQLISPAVAHYGEKIARIKEKHAQELADAEKINYNMLCSLGKAHEIIAAAGNKLGHPKSKK